MTRHGIRTARHRAMAVGKPTVNIGKKGSTDFLVSEISKQLEKREIVKVKIPKTAPVGEEAKDTAQKVSEEIKSEIVQLRWHTFTLYRPKKTQKEIKSYMCIETVPRGRNCSLR